MGWFSNLFGGGDDDNGDGGLAMTGKTVPVPVKLPDYPETDAARATWGETLQKWGSMPGYGAIAPDWNDIWDNARAKVQRYFMGGPEGPGAIATVKSNLARRGMSENPAAETQISRLGMSHGNFLQDLAVTQAIQEAQFGERGRETWLNSLMRLSGLKPSYAIGQEVYGNAPVDPVASGIGGILGNVGMDVLSQFGIGIPGTTLPDIPTTGGQGDWLQSMMGMFGSGGFDTGIGDIPSGGDQSGLFGYVDDGDSFGENSQDVWTDPQTYAQIAQIAAMFCWVAAEVFNGWDDVRTHQARYFINSVAPKWFKELYIKHGEQFAAYIKDKPAIKGVVRIVFSAFAKLGKIHAQLDCCRFILGGIYGL